MNQLSFIYTAINEESFD